MFSLSTNLYKSGTQSLPDLKEFKPFKQLYAPHFSKWNVAPASKLLFVKKDDLMQKDNVARFSAGKDFGFITLEDSS